MLRSTLKRVHERHFARLTQSLSIGHSNHSILFSSNQTTKMRLIVNIGKPLATRQLLNMKQDMLTLLESLKQPLVFVGIHVNQSIYFKVVFFTLLFLSWCFFPSFYHAVFIVSLVSSVLFITMMETFWNILSSHKLP